MKDLGNIWGRMFGERSLLEVCNRIFRQTGKLFLWWSLKIVFWDGLTVALLASKNSYSMIYQSPSEVCDSLKFSDLVHLACKIDVGYGT